jgi:DNA-binding response OmpR family regulator
MNPDEAVLVVDDDDDVRDTLQMLLEADGHFALSASSAEEAMSMIEAHQPICVILDLNMPEVGGAQLAKRIRSIHGTGVVLIVLTGSTDESDQDAAERAGVDYVLHKPLNVAHLRDLLPRVC